MRESRSDVIAHHIRLALHRSTLTERLMGQAVADLYMQRTPLHARTIEFHNSRDPYADEKANAQIVRRMLDGSVRMPVDVEEALVLCLPQPFQRQCVTELAARTGHLAAELPADSGVGQLVHAAHLMRAAAEAVAALAPMYEDGVLDASDRAHADHALAELADVEAKVATVRHSILTYVLSAEASDQDAQKERV